MGFKDVFITRGERSKLSTPACRTRAGAARGGGNAKNKELNSQEENWGLCKGQGGREEGSRALRNVRRPMWL